MDPELVGAAGVGSEAHVHFPVRENAEYFEFGNRLFAILLVNYLTRAVVPVRGKRQGYGASHFAFPGSGAGTEVRQIGLFDFALGELALD